MCGYQPPLKLAVLASLTDPCRLVLSIWAVCWESLILTCPSASSQSYKLILVLSLELLMPALSFDWREIDLLFNTSVSIGWTGIVSLGDTGLMIGCFSCWYWMAKGLSSIEKSPFSINVLLLNLLRFDFLRGFSYRLRLSVSFLFRVANVL
jgi:hypothetical protein